MWHNFYTRYNYKPPTTTIKHWQKTFQCKDISKAPYQGEKAVLHKWVGILKNKMWTPVE
jgi:hypothetical protein